MAATYNILYNDRTGRGKTMNTVEIVYSSEAYSSGVAVSGDSIGCPNVIESLVVYDAGIGYLPRVVIDYSSFNGAKIRFYEQDGSTGVLVEISSPSISTTVKVVAVGW